MDLGNLQRKVFVKEGPPTGLNCRRFRTTDGRPNSEKSIASTLSQREKGSGDDDGKLHGVLDAIVCVFLVRIELEFVRRG